LNWSVLTMLPATEHTMIVQRLPAGIMAKYELGEWIKGTGIAPLGYRLDPVAKA
jgi:hypothetical protein